MLPVRQSQATRSNQRLHHESASRAPRSNLACLGLAREAMGVGDPGDVVLIGGASLADFRIRVAQSHARHDLTPSHWSIVGILSEQGELVTAPLWPLPDPASVPARNAIDTRPLSDFDSVSLYPNLAIVRFPSDAAAVLRHVRRLRRQRTIVDLPSLILAWLGFVWATADSPNPLLSGLGLPSAVLVETVFGMADVELTPGLASASSCPEAIWQAARWWHGFYARAAGADIRQGADGEKLEAVPHGWWVVRQARASYVVPK